MAKINWIKVFGLVVFFIVLFEGAALRLCGRATALTVDQRNNCTAGSVAVLILLDIVFFGYTYLASKVNPPEPDSCCNNYFILTMIAFWGLEFLWGLFDILGAKDGISEVEFISWGLLEFIAFVAWSVLFVFNINRGSTPEEDVIPA